MYRMVQIVIAYSSPYRDPRALEPAVANMSLDWARFAPTGWLLWTSQSIYEMSERLRVLLDAEDQFFVSALSPVEVSGGRLPQWIWDWINIQRDPISGYVSRPPPKLVAPQALPTPGSQAPYWANIFGTGPPKKP